MRRRSTVLLAVALMFSFGLPVSADRPTAETSNFRVFECSLFGESGEGFVFVEAEGEFAFADAAIWLSGSIPFESEPDFFSDFEGATVSFEGDLVTADIPMIEGESGEPAGILTIDGVLGSLIEEESFSDRFREGNRWVEFNETIRFFEASATVTLGGLTFDSECSAQEVQFEFFSTNPHAFRVDFEDAFLECFGIAGSDSSTMNLFAGEFENEAFIDLQIFAPNGNGENDGHDNGEHGDGEHGEPIPELFGFSEISGLSGEIEVVVPLFDPFGGEEPVDEAHVAMTISEGETITSRIVFQDGRIKETQTELLVSGSVDLTQDRRSFDLVDCFGSRFEARGIVNEASGPKTSGRPPANDTPEGAVELEVGDHDNQQTKAAALEPEVSCTGVEVPDEFEEFHEFPAPIGKTVWYSIEGTGGPITVSTAGSNFDTMMGVYAVSGNGLEPLACVDDVFDGGFSLQAEFTWETEIDLTYFVQVGGFGLFQNPEFPEFDSLPEYGLLKFSVTE